MAEFSFVDRIIKVPIGCALPIGWWYLAPDYSRLFETPLGHVVLADLIWAIAWLVLLPFCLRATISFFYEAWTGRDSVWLWHPDN